jgi:hypothetical protein
MFGREVIYSSVTEFSRANVVDVLEKAMNIHKKNSNVIDYLINITRVISLFYTES